MRSFSECKVNNILYQSYNLASSILAGRVPIVNLNRSNLNASKNESVKNDDPYAVRLCIEHPKYMSKFLIIFTHKFF